MSAERPTSNSNQESNTERELQAVIRIWDNLYVYDVELAATAAARQVSFDELLKEKQVEIEGFLRNVRSLNLGTFRRWHDSILDTSENEEQVLKHLQDFPQGAFAQLLLEVAAVQDEREDNADDRRLILGLRKLGFLESVIPDLVARIHHKRLAVKKQILQLHTLYAEAASWMARLRYSRN